jgi:predicted esterase
MKPPRFVLILTLVGMAAFLCGLPPQAAPPAASFAPPPVTAPSKEVLQTIQNRSDKLAHALSFLRQKGVNDTSVADIEVYYKAGQWITRFNEFYQKEAGDWTVAALDNGLLRASQRMRGEFPWLAERGHAVVRGYRSRVDGSVQPYAVTFPADYANDPNKKWRLDVVLHGRNPGLTEVLFLHQHDGAKAAPNQDWVQLDIYGRGNNAYRWAGETDVIEAVANFLGVEQQLGRGGLIDTKRAVLRGFSMGGAGTWQLGLHRPDDWCVIGPGAGFTTTHGYVNGLPEKLPPYQEACLSIYDAVDYAENAADVHVVAYAGADDPQLQAARNIEARLKPLGIPMTLLVAPDTGHKFPPEWQKKAEAEYAKFLAKGQPEYRRHVHFVTWTLKYPKCDWVEILGLEQHYHKSLVDATYNDEEGYTVKTTNLRALHLTLPAGALRQATKVNIDGQKVEAQPYQPAYPALAPLQIYLEKRDGKWGSVLPEVILTRRLRVPQKVHGLQGPIDDAFMTPFLCVRGTGQAWHEATERYNEADLERFQEEWARYFRGDLPIKEDRDVTPQDVAGNDLILFGDPASNSLIAQVLPGLPLKWTKDKITWEGQDYASAEHVPVLIYPSPLSTAHYVVLNSGHTFHAADFKGTNALLYPRLGDHAILKLTPSKKDPLANEVVRAGLFDDFWRPGK